MPQEQTVNKARPIEVTAKDLPLHCPMPSQLLWNSHPRVFLPIEETGEALCPYCGTRYILKDGAIPGKH
ncbi:MAG: zinc-finger domain-containing protein [Burkholderiales bacterium]